MYKSRSESVSKFDEKLLKYRIMLKDILSGNAYRVATLSKLFLTTAGIIMKSLKLIGQFQYA